jgi:enoyl-CoA hydratase/carnithine racemase
MVDQWHDHLADASANAGVRAIVVTGAGRAFCAGGDFDHLKAQLSQNAIERKDFLFHHVHRIALLMERMDKPVIAAINGPAHGAGMDMAIMCDLRIAAQSATFCESYINVGLVAGDGGMYYLPRIVGTAKALEMFWTGDVITAAEAERLGIVNRVVPDGEALKAAQNLAARIAKQPQLAIRLFRRGTYQMRHMPLDAALDSVSSHMAVLYDTPEHHAKVNAFLDRKKKG